MSPKFKIGDRVRDCDGYLGTIVEITEWRGSIWYDVRFQKGNAVRYDQDLESDLEPGQ